MKIIPKFQHSRKISNKEQNKRKQQFLNQNGIKVKINGSWGPWQEQQYRRLTTKDKHYNTTPLGFLSYLYDKTLGNGTTYQEDPAIVKGYSGEIKPDNRSSARRYLDQQMQDNKTPLGYITQTVLPSAAVASSIVYGGPAIINGIRTAVSNSSTILPAAKTLAKEGVKGIAGATAVNAASKATTGKTWGEQVSQSIGISSDLGEFTNPGFVLGSQVYNIGKNLYNKRTPYILQLKGDFSPTLMASLMSNPDEYIGKASQRVINFIKGKKSVHKGLEEAINFIQSKAVKDSKEINQKIADRLGLSKQPEYDLRPKPVVYHKKFEQKNFNLKGVNPDNVAGYYDPNKETVNLLQHYSNPISGEHTAFHEKLHALNYGPSSVNDWKIQYLIDKNKVKNMSQRNKDYYLSSKELPVHTAELGKYWGVKPGQPYPGDKTFDEMLYNNGISGSAYYLKYDTPKDKRRFWRTLNGTMFGLTLLPNVINKYR